jgi:hypothetical protein
MLISEQSITYHICTWERSKANNTLVLLLVLKLTKQAPPEGICAAALSAQTCSWGGVLNFTQHTPQLQVSAQLSISH